MQHLLYKVVHWCIVHITAVLRCQRTDAHSQIFRQICPDNHLEQPQSLLALVALAQYSHHLVLIDIRVVFLRVRDDDNLIATQIYIFPHLLRCRQRSPSLDAPERPANEPPLHIEPPHQHLVYDSVLDGNHCNITPFPLGEQLVCPSRVCLPSPVPQPPLQAQKILPQYVRGCPELQSVLAVALLSSRSPHIAVVQLIIGRQPFKIYILPSHFKNVIPASPCWSAFSLPF